ncbi:hypothetical protein Cni_G07222 [Canna indica]|uniref:Uncharacterized protein n=1 Tax=Canna indica TaxID=4628 RepID=A0AAQ3K399_9LILI|nr:hypothetical protein Cni_G07222 [Canna indica]
MGDDGGAPGPQQAERDDGGNDNTGSDASFELDLSEEHSATEGNDLNPISLSSGSNGTTLSGLRSHRDGPIGSAHSAGTPLPKERRLADSRRRLSRVSFLVVRSSRIPDPPPAKCLPRGDLPVAPMGRVAASRSPRCSGGLSNLVLHRANLSSTPDAGDRLVRIRMGVSEDSFSEALLQIDGFAILVFVGKSSASLSAFVRSWEKDKLWLTVGWFCFLVTDPGERRSACGFLFNLLSLVVKGFEWCRVPSLAVESAPNERARGLGRELAAREFNPAEHRSSTAHESGLPEIEPSLEGFGLGSPIHGFELGQVQAIPAHLGNMKVREKRCQPRRCMTVRRSTRIAGRSGRSSLKNASVIKAARNEGFVEETLSSPLMRPNSDHLGSITFDMGTALDDELIKDVEALGFDCSASKERVIRALRVVAV